MTTVNELIDTLIPYQPNVKRESSCYRPMYAQGKQIGRIVLHDGQNILYTKQSGWLEQTASTEELSYSGRDITGFFIDVRQARTINLGKKDHFIIKYSDRDKSYYEEGYALYIYAPDFKIIKQLREEKLYETHTCDLCQFTIPALVTKGALDERGKFYYQEERINTITMQFNYKTEKTWQGEVFESLRKDLNSALGRDVISSYDLEKLVEHFNITRK